MVLSKALILKRL